MSQPQESTDIAAPEKSIEVTKPSKTVPKSVVNKDGKMFFKNNLTFLPVTMKQFEDLTNEILSAVNMLSAPNFLEADYMAQVLMSAIHALKHENGMVRKSELFESVVNRISCHITYHAVEEIQKRIKAQAAQAGEEIVIVETPTTNEASTDASTDPAPSAGGTTPGEEAN
jgi:hypothetical protein